MTPKIATPNMSTRRHGNCFRAVIGLSAPDEPNVLFTMLTKGVDSLNWLGISVSSLPQTLVRLNIPTADPCFSTLFAHHRLDLASEFGDRAEGRSSLQVDGQQPRSRHGIPGGRLAADKTAEGIELVRAVRDHGLQSG
jgi:hypothetical protein